MKNRVIFLICVLWGCCIIASAQKSANIRPKWLGNTPNAEKGFYFVEVHSDASTSLQAARMSVKQEIASNVERVDKVSVSEIFEDKSVQQYDYANNVAMNSRDSYQLYLKVDGEARPIKSRRIDEYWEVVERGGASVLDYHALYAVERNGETADFSGISTVSHYGVHGLWRSAIVPGWGQLYKGSTVKGSMILGGTALLIGGAIYTDIMRADYANKITKTHSADNKRTYATRRDNFAMGRNICLGALGALYVYNLIDAIVAPGARRILVHERPGGKSYSMLPSVTSEWAPAVAFTMTF